MAKQPKKTVKVSVDKAAKQIARLEGLLVDRNRALLDSEARCKALQAEVDEASEWRMDIRKQVQLAEQSTKHWKGEADKLREEGNELRRLLYISEQETSRLRGYLEGLEDSKPPRMVEEQREHPLAKFRDISAASEMFRTSGNVVYDVGGSERRRPAWYER